MKPVIIQKFLNNWLPILLFLLSLSLYLYTIAPGWGAINIFNTWDGLEYVLSSYLLGIDHPPGHPFYLMLGKLFTFIPIGSLAYRINLLSAFFGTLTVVMVFLGVELTLKLLSNEFKEDLRKAIAAFSSLTFALSYVFWTHSIIPEVHTLYLFIISSSIYSVLKWRELNDIRWLYGGVFLLGLAVSVSIFNALTVLLPVALFILIVKFSKDEEKSIKEWATLIALFMVPLLFYLYYPIRATKFPDFIHTMNFTSPYTFGSLQWFIWYISGSAWTGAGMFNLLRVFSNIPNYLTHINGSFTIISLLLSLIAFVVYIKDGSNYIINKIKNKLRIKQLINSAPERLKLFTFYFLLFTFILIPQLSLRDPSNPESATYVYVANFYLPSFLIFIYFVGIGLSVSVDYILKSKIPEFFRIKIGEATEIQKRIWFLLFVYILLIIPVYLLAASYPKCNLRGDEGGYLYAKKAVSEIPKSSIIFSKLVYQLVGAYFEKIEPILKGKNILIVSPDAPPFYFRSQDLLFKYLKTAKLKEAIKEYQKKNMPVYLSGDSVEEDKAPEGLLLADVNFKQSIPSIIPSDLVKPFPSELILYKVGLIRKAEILKKVPPIKNKGIANNGNFRDTFELLGFDEPEVENVERGRNKMTLKFYWKVLEEIKEDLLGVFVVFDERLGRVDPQRTAWFFTLGGERVTSKWKKGQILEDEIYYYLPSLPFGRYFLALGLMKLNGETIPYYPAGHKEKFDFVLLMPFGIGIPLQ